MRWSGERGLILISALIIYAGIFSGRFSLARIIPDAFSSWPLLGEVRVWVILMGIILVGVEWLRAKRSGLLIVEGRVWLGVGCIVLAQLVLILHSILYKAGANVSYFIFELMALSIVAVLVGMSYQIWGGEIVKQIMLTGFLFSLALAALFFEATVFGQIFIREGILKSAFSFYRVQFFGGFSALILYCSVDKNKKLEFLLLLGAIFVFSSAYLTLSKAAILVGTSTLLLLAFIYVTWFEWRKSVAVIAVAFGAVGVFVAVSGGVFAARINQGVLGVGYVPELSMITPPSTVAAVTSSRGALVLGATPEEVELASFEAQLRLAKLMQRSSESVRLGCCEMPQGWDVVVTKEQEIANYLLQFHAYLPDYSFRIRLLTHGFRGISNAPWLGNGYGSFHAVAANLYTGNQEIYFYPHNVLVELLHAIGAAGSFLIGCLLLSLIWLVLCMREKTQPALPVLAFAIAVGAGSLLGGDYMDFRLVWLGLLLCVMLSSGMGAERKLLR